VSKKIQVYIIATASKYIGEVEVETENEFLDKANKLWTKQDCEAPDINITNKFDLSDWDIDESDVSSYFKTDET